MEERGRTYGPLFLLFVFHFFFEGFGRVEVGGGGGALGVGGLAAGGPEGGAWWVPVFAWGMVVVGVSWLFWGMLSEELFGEVPFLRRPRGRGVLVEDAVEVELVQVDIVVDCPLKV